MQTLLRDPAAGVMHSFIYFGFLVLFAATVILEIDHQMPESLKFLHGGVYKAYAATADLFGVIFIIGIVWAIGRRYGQRPYRIRIKSKPEHALILGTLGALAITGFGAAEGGEGGKRQGGCARHGRGKEGHDGGAGQEHAPGVCAASQIRGIAQSSSGPGGGPRFPLGHGGRHVFRAYRLAL